MKKIIQIILSLFCVFSIEAQSQSLKEIESHRILLPNQWGITPIGKSLPLGDLPLNISVSKSKKLIAVTNNGQSVQSIQLIDATKRIILDNIQIAKSWLGLVFSDDEKMLYASGGNDNMIIAYNIVNKKLLPKDTFVLGKPWPEMISPTGITLDDEKNMLYVVTKENNSLYTVDLTKKNKTERYELGAEAYTCILCL